MQRRWSLDLGYGSCSFRQPQEQHASPLRGGNVRRVIKSQPRCPSISCSTANWLTVPLQRVGISKIAPRFGWAAAATAGASLRSSIGRSAVLIVLQFNRPSRLHQCSLRSPSVSRCACKLGWSTDPTRDLLEARRFGLARSHLRVAEWEELGAER